MHATIVIAVIIALVTIYVVRSRRKDTRVVREHQARIAALAPGPRIRELTTVRPNPLTTRRMATGSQPMSPDDFKHVPTDYGTYTPAEIEMAILGRADTEVNPAVPACAEIAPHHGVSHHDACSTHDTSFGGFDGGGHHGH